MTQKCGCIILTLSSFRPHTDVLFNITQILQVPKVYVYREMIFMYKLNNNLLPSVFNYMFKKNVDVHMYPTRLQGAFHLPVARCVI